MWNFSDTYANFGNSPTYYFDGSPLSPVASLPTLGNANMAQRLQDFGIAAGYAFVVAMSPHAGPNAAMAAEYQHGTHAVQIYNAQAGTQLFHSAAPRESTSALAHFIATQGQYPEPRPPLVIKSARVATAAPYQSFPFVVSAPQQHDPSSYLQPFMDAPTIVSSVCMGWEYQFGTHQKTLYDSQNGTAVWASLPTPQAPGHQVPLRSIHVLPQEVYRDLTQQPWITQIPTNQGWILTYAGASPQSYDFTLQPLFDNGSQLVHAQAPVNPAYVIAKYQQDPSQPAPAIWTPPLRVIKPMQQPFITAQPTPWDPRVIMGQVFRPRGVQPSNYVQPTLVIANEQLYTNIFPNAFAQAQPNYIPPPPFTGFWVQAVTAGWYGGRFRTPGDIFLLAQAADFSDSTIDYQAGSNGVGYGWMTRTTATAAYDWLESNGSPYLPPQDPLRRTVY
jgi:hypothetical protein